MKEVKADRKTEVILRVYARLLRVTTAALKISAPALSTQSQRDEILALKPETLTPRKPRAPNP